MQPDQRRRSGMGGEMVVEELRWALVVWDFTFLP